MTEEDPDDDKALLLTEACTRCTCPKAAGTMDEAVPRGEGSAAWRMVGRGSSL